MSYISPSPPIFDPGFSDFRVGWRCRLCRVLHFSAGTPWRGTRRSTQRPRPSRNSWTYVEAQNLIGALIPGRNLSFICVFVGFLSQLLESDGKGVLGGGDHLCLCFDELNEYFDFTCNFTSKAYQRTLTGKRRFEQFNHLKSIMCWVICSQMTHVFFRFVMLQYNLHRMCRGWFVIRYQSDVFGEKTSFQTKHFHFVQDGRLRVISGIITPLIGVNNKTGTHLFSTTYRGPTCWWFRNPAFTSWGW